MRFPRYKHICSCIAIIRCRLSHDTGILFRCPKCVPVSGIYCTKYMMRMQSLLFCTNKTEPYLPRIHTCSGLARFLSSPEPVLPRQKWKYSCPPDQQTAPCATEKPPQQSILHDSFKLCFDIAFSSTHRISQSASRDFASSLLSLQLHSSINYLKCLFAQLVHPEGGCLGTELTALSLFPFYHGHTCSRKRESMDTRPKRAI